MNGTMLHINCLGHFLSLSLFTKSYKKIPTMLIFSYELLYMGSDNSGQTTIVYTEKCFTPNCDSADSEKETKNADE